MNDGVSIAAMLKLNKKGVPDVLIRCQHTASDSLYRQWLRREQGAPSFALTAAA